MVIIALLLIKVQAETIYQIDVRLTPIFIFIDAFINKNEFDLTTTANYRKS